MDCWYISSQQSTGWYKNWTQSQQSQRRPCPLNIFTLSLSPSQPRQSPISPARLIAAQWLTFDSITRSPTWTTLSDSRSALGHSWLVCCQDEELSNPSLVYRWYIAAICVGARNRAKATTLLCSECSFVVSFTHATLRITDLYIVVHVRLVHDVSHHFPHYFPAWLDHRTPWMLG